MTGWVDWMWKLVWLAILGGLGFVLLIKKPHSLADPTWAIYFLAVGILITVTWWLSQKTEAPDQAPRAFLLAIWIFILFVSVSAFSNAITTVTRKGYTYAGQNFNAVEAVAATVAATFTVIYVVCTVALVWQAQAARASQERNAEEQLEVQNSLAAAQAKTNALLAANITTLTQFVENQQKAQPSTSVANATQQTNRHHGDTTVAAGTSNNSTP